MNRALIASALAAALVLPTAALAQMAGPYWLLCGENCEVLLTYLDERDRTATFLASKTNADNGKFSAYRID